LPLSSRPGVARTPRPRRGKRTATSTKLPANSTVTDADGLAGPLDAQRAFEEVLAVVGDEPFQPRRPTVRVVAGPQMGLPYARLDLRTFLQRPNGRKPQRLLLARLSEHWDPPVLVRRETYYGIGWDRLGL
jgi:hypothetical protein